MRLDVRRRERPEHAARGLGDLHIHFLAGLVLAPLHEFFISIKMFVIITIVRSFKLHFIVVFFRGFVGLALSSESFDDAFGFCRLRRVRVGIYKVDDLRVVSWCRRDSSPSHELVGGLWAKFEPVRARSRLGVSTRSESRPNALEIA